MINMTIMAQSIFKIVLQESIEGIMKHSGTNKYYNVKFDTEVKNVFFYFTILENFKLKCHIIFWTPYIYIFFYNIYKF